MIARKISNIVTAIATIVLGLLGLAFAFIEARMLIANDFAAYAVPWFGMAIAICRLISALLFMVLFPLLGLFLKINFFRLGIGLGIFSAGLLYKQLAFGGAGYSLILGWVVLGAATLYDLGGIICPRLED